MTAPTPLLEVADLRVAFESPEHTVVHAVDRVSFSVGEGETVGIVGESGCGKTVTALSLLGLLPPAARIDADSAIRLRGEDLVRVSAKRLGELRGDVVSMIFQDPMSSLNPVLRVGDQVAEDLRLHQGMGRSEAREAAAVLFDEVGIPRPRRSLDAHPHRLSGGMRQRVMIAMALACRPALLIADEPTTALDVTVQAQILDLLANLQEKHRMAVLLISHDLDVVARFCRRVLVMYAGELVETGSIRRIFEAPRHPYTRALLDARPRLSGPRGMMALSGRPPAPGARPSGCRLLPRCPHARASCRREQVLVEVEAGSRRVRCGRHRELGILQPATP